MNLPCLILVAQFPRRASSFEGQRYFVRGLQICSSRLRLTLQKQSTYELKLLPKFLTTYFFNIARKLSYSSGLCRQSKMGKKGNKMRMKPADGDNANKSEKTFAPKIPTIINLVTIGTGGPGNSQCLLLATEHSRFMFNCGEGSQRLILMNKKLRSSAFAKLTGVDNIFITQKSWEALGGLLGLAMTKYHSQTQADSAEVANKPATTGETPASDRPHLSLYGPEGIEKITSMARQFAEQLHMNIVRKTGEYEDPAMKISPLVFHERVSEKNAEAEKTEDNLETPSRPKRRRTDSGDLEKQPKVSVEDPTVQNEVKPPTPKINVAKCVDAGITLGPMVGQLQRGFSVTLEDGTVVHPSQVTDTPATQNRDFLVIDCPSEAYFQSLNECSTLRQYRKQAEGDYKESFCLIVHMTPANVYNSPYYKTWMEGFGTDTDHLIMNGDANSSEVPRIRNYQAHLNVVNSEIFPMLPESGDETTVSQLSSMSSAEENAEFQDRLFKSIRRACFGLIYTIRGKELGFHMESDDFDLAALHDQIEIPEVKSELETLRQIMSSCPTVKKNEDEYPKFVFLGTGSSQPSAYRGQSFILVHTSEDSSLILDCGEDSYGQLFRFYGASETKNILRKIKAIFVSHLHGDHHMGLVTLLREREKSFEELKIPFEPTILLAPIQLRRWLRFYQREMGQISHLFRCFHHQKSQKVTDGDTSFTLVSEDCVLREAGLKEYVPIKVIHCRDAYGLLLTLNNGFKFVYSGDTRPCLQLAEIGEGCDLLIHEATHDDSLRHLAIAAKHSTFSEAMDIGVQMKAKNIILTHFSQRYTHMIPFMKAVPSNIGIAFDNMQVSHKNISWLSKFIPALTIIFDDKLKRNIKHIKARNNNS